MTTADLVALLKKHPLAVACAIISVMCGAAFYFRMDVIDTARDEFERADREAKAVSLNARMASGLPEATGEMREAGKQFDARLMQAQQLANNLQVFYRLENDTGVKLIDLRQLPLPAPKAGAARGPYTPIPFNLSVQGDYAQVHNFLHRLETGPHFARFTQVSVTKRAAVADTTASGAKAVPAGGISANINLEMLGTP